MEDLTNVRCPFGEAPNVAREVRAGLALRALPGTRRCASKFPGDKGARLSTRIIFRALIFGLLILDLTGCATVPHHQFAEPSGNWQTRSGQLLYRNATTTIIGEVVVRFSKSGDFELTFSKGPGVTLLTIRQDASFAQARGAIARTGWSGPIDRAPHQLLGWLTLREKLIQALAMASPSGGGQDRQSVRHATGAETFLFRF